MAFQMRVSTTRALFLPISGKRPAGQLATRRPVWIRTATASPYVMEQNDFVGEMKKVAMYYHTKDQAKAGEQKTARKPFHEWEYSLEGYLRFLVESRHVYKTFECILGSNDAYSLFRDTGLDRVVALDHDIAWISAEHALPVPEISDESPSKIYAQYQLRLLEDLSQQNVSAFVCHYYNFYLAHTAGGRMIGKKVADAVLSGAFERLAFYQYDSNLRQLVNNLKSSINKVALEWTQEEKENALDQTVEAFKHAGSIMRTMFDDDDM